MTETNKDKKKENSEGKIFTVPIPLGEIKENFTFKRETPSQLSKEQIINQAFKFHSEGNISEAERYYRYCINQGFNDPKVFVNYGVLLQDLGKLKDAEIFTNKAIKLEPNFEMAHLNLGQILSNLGESKKAEYSTRKAIELKPDFADAHANLGNILKDLGKLKDAENSYLRAIKIKPNHLKANYNLGQLFCDLGKLNEAETATRKTIEIIPDFADAHCNLGIILRAQWVNNQDLGKLKEAESSQRKAIEIDPGLIRAHIKLGEILFHLGKPEEANICEWNAIKINNTSPFLKSYIENAKLINKTAFCVFSYTVFNHFRPIIEINPNFFEILVPDNIDKELILKISNDLGNREIRIRSEKELIENKLIYDKLVSISCHNLTEFIQYKNNIKRKENVISIKLFGKKNIRFMYTAGKDKYTISSYWNKYYDGIMCYGPYHENKFKTRHEIPTSQMGYPRFDKYFNPGFQRDSLIKKFKCNPKKKTIVWITTWTELSSINKYLKAISSLTSHLNVVIRPHPSMKKDDPENYKRLFTEDLNYIDDNEDDNVQLYALADLMLFDYGGSMFGSLYLNKNFAFLDMKLEAKNNKYLGDLSSEDYLKSFFPERIANLDNLASICDYCLKNPPSNSIIKSLREEFFNINYQGNSAKKAYDLLRINNWYR